MANDSKSIKAHKFLLKISKRNKHTKFNNYLSQSNIISIDSRMDKQNDLQFFIVKTIIGQQVSVSAARSIWKKVEIYLKEKNSIISTEELAKCGLSKPKAKYIYGVINNKDLKSVSKKTLQAMQDNELSEFFLQIKGIGPWTLGIIKMFYLGNSDTFLNGDLAIKKRALYFFNDSEYMGIDYSPYKTYLCLYLWQSLSVKLD
jgi:DNA-3-methyladenine glycosylase II|tara:strand:+ start:30 stop:635 length:606 start_codon:yes stop_codon:yes gene_type:complete